jgi:hypothetical protein
MSLEYVTSRLGNVKPETRSIAEELYNEAKKAGHEIWFMWGMGSSTEHRTGLALDLMVRNNAGGDWIRNYLWTHRKRLRLRHVIWEQHITSTVIQPGKRRKMEDRGNATANHFDHVHTWHFAGKYQPPAKSEKLGEPFDKPLEVDGIMGKHTIMSWQRLLDVPMTGVMDEATIKAVQTKLKATVDHRLVVDAKGLAQDGKRYKTVGALQRYLGTPVDQIMSKPVSQVVKALQRRLKTGRF